jgi:hypothetical protein
MQKSTAKFHSQNEMFYPCDNQMQQLVLDFVAHFIAITGKMISCFPPFALLCLLCV